MAVAPGSAKTYSSVCDPELLPLGIDLATRLHRSGICRAATQPSLIEKDKLMLYAAQYRNMHTAIHHLSIFTKRSGAEKMVKFIEENQTLPPCDQQGDVEDIEINFRHVPETYKDSKLTVVNSRPSIPDCYGC